MKQIKFRAKATVNDKYNNIKVGDFVYGCYIESGCDAPCIIFGDGEQIEVDKTTLGLLTEIPDCRKGKEVYTGDIVKFSDQEDLSNESNGYYSEEVTRIGAIHWDEAEHCFDVTNRDDDRLNCLHEVEVIGNIYDNKELLSL